MRKRVLFLSLLAVVGLFLVACNKTTELTSITFSGADNVTLDFDATFNVLEGVTALGNDGVDYTDQITYVSTSDITDDLLSTTATGNHAIPYNVYVGEFLAQTWRYITVNEPQAVEGEMLVNPDFATGTTGWDSDSVLYKGDGDLTLTNDEGTLKAEVVAGAYAYTPRFGQMNVPFENGTTYLVSFDAKSSVEKIINLQVGELLTYDPWFVDFKPGLTIHKTITTEWATYSYKFTMNQEETNHRGGLLFELGTVESQKVDATMWFDNVKVEVSTPDADETAPVFSGLTETKSVLIGADFDPMSGVSAFDVVDGDMTDSIDVVIKDGADAVVQAVDTSVAGTYTITYTVTDEAGNEAEFIVTLEVVGMQFSNTNLVVNGTFDNALGDPAEWVIYDDGSFVTASGIDNTNGEYAITTAGSPANPYSVKLMQSGLTLVEGTTYRVVVTMKSSATRTVNVALGIPYDVDPWWTEYARFNAVELTTDYQTFEFVFTSTLATSETIQIVIEMGNTDEYGNDTVTLSDVAVNEALLDDILVNSNFADSWYVWSNDNSLTYNRDGGQFNVVVANVGSETWHNQFNTRIDLAANTTYVVSFDAMALVARDINVKVFNSSYTNYLAQLDVMLTTSMATYTYEFTTPAEGQMSDLVFGFEFGSTTNAAVTTVSFDNISILEKDNASAVQVVSNGDATSPEGWTMFNENGSATTLSLVDGGLQVELTALGGLGYQPHLYQMIDSLTAGTYTIKVVVSADVARDLNINVSLPNSGYAVILPDQTPVTFTTLENDQVEVSVTFTVTAEITNVKVEIDFGTLGGDAVSTTGTFVLEQIYIYQIYS